MSFIFRYIFHDLKLKLRICKILQLYSLSFADNVKIRYLHECNAINLLYFTLVTCVIVNIHIYVCKFL